MRNREVIEREMYRAREDLEQSLAALKHTVQEKIDVKARARVAMERGKQSALDLYAKAAARPAVVGAIAGSVVALGALAYIGRQREWW
jgi:hypothetical protein